MLPDMIRLLTDVLSSPFSLFHVLFTGLVGYWIYVDATERGSDAALSWAGGCAVFQPLTIGYLLYRSEIGERTDPAAASERAIGTFVIAHLVAIQLRFVLRYSGLITPPVPSPVVELLYYVGLLVVGILPAYWLIWQRGWARTRRKIGWSQKSEGTEV
jgi:hypothetical protein